MTQLELPFTLTAVDRRRIADALADEIRGASSMYHVDRSLGERWRDLPTAPHDLDEELVPVSPRYL